MSKNGKVSNKKGSSEISTTPMMAQYLAIKQDYPDIFLFYRMGDFYELFFDDAVKASEILGITLTRRGKQNGKDIPMCGVPVRNADTYLERLIHSGAQVAVCEQVEDSQISDKRSRKILMGRQVERLVTPGTLTEDSLLNSRVSNYLSAIGRAGGNWAVSWCDISTGEFKVIKCDSSSLSEALSRLSPREILISDSTTELHDISQILVEWKSVISLQPPRLFDSVSGNRHLCSLYNVQDLGGLDHFDRSEVSAAGAIVEYLNITQKGKFPRLSVLTRVSQNSSMAIDAATRRNLELTHSFDGSRKKSLLTSIDDTITGSGARLLHSRLVAPLTDPVAIAHRLNQVEYFLLRSEIRNQLRITLRGFPDVERALSRLALGRGGPRDLFAVGQALSLETNCRDIFENNDNLHITDGAVDDILLKLGQHNELARLIKSALSEPTPLLVRDGGFIASGYSIELDELIALRDESRRHIADLQVRYRTETSVDNLKVKHNRVLGYFIDVTERHSKKLGTKFYHCQTLANSVRFKTVELGELESRINSAGQRALELEEKLFNELLAIVLSESDKIALMAEAFAELDVASGLAQLAIERDFTRPKVDLSLEFNIKNGRHPVVEKALGGAKKFISNDCDLGVESHLWLVTGPNMAGKSTFLRQNALITILAQMGSFVPAASAHIGIVHRLFSRVGAADDLASGRSTFMVEMIEAATILNLANKRSLVILDEMGRGTATFDGLAIAWAAVEHLHEVNKCRTLFATHYHELTSLASRLSRLSCNTIKVKEWKNEVIFLHEVSSGVADRSYGIHVARLAGLPVQVLNRAENLLISFEEGKQEGIVRFDSNDLPLFSYSDAVSSETKEYSKLDELRVRLSSVDADSLSPRSALDLIYHLRSILDKE